MRPSSTGPRIALASLLTALTVAVPVGAQALPPMDGAAAPAIPATVARSAAERTADDSSAAENSAAGHSRRTLTIAAAAGLLLGAGALAAGLALGFPRRALTEGLQRRGDRIDGVPRDDPPEQG